MVTSLGDCQMRVAHGSEAIRPRSIARGFSVPARKRVFSLFKLPEEVKYDSSQPLPDGI